MDGFLHPHDPQAQAHADPIALAGTRLTIIDGRFSQSGAPTIDLRPTSGAPPTTNGE